MLIRTRIVAGVHSAKSLERQIAALFRLGEQGAWYDPSDWSALSQDSAGTLPVTAVGQPVGRMLDKSGRGNHATQPTAINRPVLQQDASGRLYLAFNGTNSWMSAAAIDLTGTDKLMLTAGISSPSPAGQTILIEHGASFGSAGTFGFVRGNAVSGVFAYSTAGATQFKGVSAGLATAAAAVIAGTVNFANPASSEVALRLNRVTSTILSNPTEENTGSFGSQSLYIGARAGSSQFFSGNLYGLVLRGALGIEAQIASAERFMNSKTGAW